MRDGVVPLNGYVAEPPVRRPHNSTTHSYRPRSILIADPATSPNGTVRNTAGLQMANGNGLKWGTAMSLIGNPSPHVGSETLAELRRRAERARHLAYQMTREDDREHLREYAVELEARVAQTETESRHDDLNRKTGSDRSWNIKRI